MAEKKKGGGSADDVMSVHQLKPLLMKSKQDPVSCALGLGDGTAGVVLLDRKVLPKRCRVLLTGSAKSCGLVLDTGTIRYGYAEVDPEVDATLVRFRVNKAAPATLVRAVRERVKLAGFPKVEFLVDAAIDAEPEVPAGDAAPESPAGDAEPELPAGEESEGETVVETSVEEPVASPPELDENALRRRLAELIPAIAGAPADRVAALKQLAGNAAGRLKEHDLVAATVLIDELAAGLSPTTTEKPAGSAELGQRLGTLAPDLRRAKQLAGDGFAAVQARLGEVQRLQAAGDLDAALDLMDDIELTLASILPPSNVSFQKLRLRWSDAEKQAVASVAKLRATLAQEYAGDEILANTDKLDELMAALKEDLADTLDAFGNAEPGAARDALKQTALQLVTGYLDLLETSELVEHVEDNPFEPVALGSVLIQPLQLLEAELSKGGA